mmetsp:Transcript_9500/g.19361  ORF Transcript_9500/g.19361 Transcript_9500/m.19361 type:complete len:86 (-) Transcript_9500:943-1200(-)
MLLQYLTASSNDPSHSSLVTNLPPPHSNTPATRGKVMYYSFDNIFERILTKLHAQGICDINFITTSFYIKIFHWQLLHYFWNSSI